MHVRERELVQLCLLVSESTRGPRTLQRYELSRSGAACSSHQSVAEENFGGRIFLLGSVGGSLLRRRQRRMDRDEYSNFFRRMNAPRVVIDNDCCDIATVIRVDSLNRNGFLLDVVQVIADLNFVITKAYISSDGSWFMEVFNVTDRGGNKIVDKEIIATIKESLEEEQGYSVANRNSVGVVASKDFTAIELTATDRPGLLSDICAVLADHNCNVKNAELWTHNTRVAAVIHITDASSGNAIEDQKQISVIKKVISNLLRGNNDPRAARTVVSVKETHRERRLHQMMLDDRDYERAYKGCASECNSASGPYVAVMSCPEKDYTVVTMRSNDRPKLLFDTVCTLTDMDYVVYHGTVSAGEEAYQEYYIRHADGHPISSETERQRLIQCLEAAILRRTSEGVGLELRTRDQVGLLSRITRTIREYGLTIRRAEISTVDDRAVDTFYVTEASGEPVKPETVRSIQEQLGHILKVKDGCLRAGKEACTTGAAAFVFGHLLKLYRPFQNLGSIRFD